MSQESENQKSGCLVLLAVLSLPVVGALGYYMGFLEGILGQWITIIAAVTTCVVIVKHAEM